MHSAVFFFVYLDIHFIMCFYNYLLIYDYKQQTRDRDKKNSLSKLFRLILTKFNFHTRTFNKFIVFFFQHFQFQIYENEKKKLSLH